MHAGELELARMVNGRYWRRRPFRLCSLVCPHTCIVHGVVSLPVTVIRPWQLLYSIGTTPTAALAY